MPFPQYGKTIASVKEEMFGKDVRGMCHALLF